MQLAFGTNKTIDSDLTHQNALDFALQHGIVIVETSTHYTDGQAIQLVKRALQQHQDKPIQLLSTFMHDTNTSLTNNIETHLKELDRSSTDIAIFSGFDTILTTNISDEKNYKSVQKEVYEHIYNAFVTFEKAYQNEQIASYGIYSEAFIQDNNSLYFLPYNVLIEIATLASEEAGNKEHHFTHIGFPLNLVENKGLEVAQWAKESNLTTFVNRVFNAMHKELPFRLATYVYPNLYDTILNETINFLQTHSLDIIANIVTELDAVSHRFGFIGEYNSFLLNNIVPALQKELEALDEETAHSVARSLEAFLEEMDKKVRYETSKTTRTTLKNLGITTRHAMQESALEYLENNDDIDIAIVGMRTPSYVEEALSIVQRIKDDTF